MDDKAIQEALSADASTGVPFEQFRLFYQSTELVTDRRLALNRSNASLASLFVAGLGIAAGWSFDHQDTVPITFTAIALSSSLGVIFCRWWWKQVEAYKDLNSAKFRVLAEMAKSLVFEGSPSERRCAFDPFKWEWLILEG